MVNRPPHLPAALPPSLQRHKSTYLWSVDGRRSNLILCVTGHACLPDRLHARWVEKKEGPAGQLCNISGVTFGITAQLESKWHLLFFVVL